MASKVIRATSVVVVASLLAFAQGCETQKDPPATPPAESAKVAPSTAAPSSAAPATAAPSTAHEPKKSNVAWTAPPSFHPAESPSTMRKATYRIEKAKGDAEDAEMTVISAGGGLEQNVTRWSMQFEGMPAPKRSERNVGGLKVSLVEIDGTFSGGNMPGSPATPKKKWRLLGAIVEVGGETTFFKLTGPDATVLAARKDFDTLVDSFKMK